MASANAYEKLPNGDAPSLDVLSPPAHFLAQYEGKKLDALQLQEAREDLATARYRFDAGQLAWVKA